MKKITLKRTLTVAMAAAMMLGTVGCASETETKNTTTLVVGILALIPPIDFVFWILDLVTEITNDRITILAD